MIRVPWVAITTLLAGLGIRASTLLRPWEGVLPGCLFKRWTGVACATCGLTRCMLALGRGTWGEAWHWHPFAVIGVTVLPVAAVWDLHRAWHRRPYPHLPQAGWVRFGVWFILGLIWAVQAVRGI